MTLLVPVDGDVSVDVTASPSTIAVEGGPVIALVVSATPHLPPGAAKPADRSFWDAALGVARSHGAHVAVMVSEGGLILDTSQATIWVVRGATLLTPPSPPALAGVSRGFVLDVAPTLGLVAKSAELVPPDLDDADEVFLTTAVAGAVAVRGRGGPVSEMLAAEFERVFAADGGCSTC